MKFCVKCDNMYYIGINEKNPNMLSHYCRNCGHVDSTLTETSCIMKHDVKQGEQKYNHIINEYTKLDPTLPRVHNMKCPSVECDSHKDGKKSEILYIRYDEDNLKYLYMCTFCDNTWKTDDHRD